MVKILVIRFRRIGDAVLSTALCTTLKRSIPNCEVHYVLNDNIAPLFSNHPDIDHIITFSRHDMSNYLRYIRKVRKVMKEGKYDIIVDMRATVKTLVFSFFSMRSKYRIGYYKWYNPILHNYRISTPRNIEMDTITSSLYLLDPLQKEYQIQKVHDFKLSYTPEEYSSFRSYMQANGVDMSQPIITCAVSARLEYKVWPLPYMKQVLQQVLDKYKNVQLVFNYGDAREKQQAIELHNMLGNDSRVHTKVEANSLRELVAMIANSTFFFGNEGGPRHIAQALNIPSFAIFPPGIPISNWLPNKSDRFQGIELKDIDQTADTNKDLSYEEKFSLIKPNFVWDILDRMLTTYL